MVTHDEGDYNPQVLDKRIWVPRVGMHPKQEWQRWVHKPVTVIWNKPEFVLVGAIKTVDGPEKIWEIRNSGYVLELDADIAEDELLHIPTPKET